jgi:hypothetical protein
MRDSLLLDGHSWLVKLSVVVTITVLRRPDRVGSPGKRIDDEDETTDDS